MRKVCLVVVALFLLSLMSPRRAHASGRDIVMPVSGGIAISLLAVCIYAAVSDAPEEEPKTTLQTDAKATRLFLNDRYATNIPKQTP